MTAAFRNRFALLLAGLGLSVCAVVNTSANTGDTHRESEGQIVPDTAKSITAIMRSDGAFSYALVEPLSHQYEAAMAAGDLEVARDMLLTIQHLIHREYGVLSPLQRSVLDKLANVQLRSRQADEADHAYRLSHFIATKQFGEEWSSMAPELQSLIQWQITTGQFRRARRSLTDAIKQAEEQEDSLSLASFLIQSAQLREFSWYCCAGKFINRAIELLESLPEGTDSAPLHTQIGDLLLAGNDVERARHHYEFASQLNATGDYSEPQPLPGKYVLPNQVRDSLAPRTEVYTGNAIARSSSPLPPDLDPAVVWEGQIQGGQRPRVARLLPESMAGSVVLNRNRQDPSSSRQVYFVGAPIEFVESQIYHALPRSQKNPDALSNMSLSFRVDISQEGRVRAIRALGEARRSPLYRTVQRALRVLRFRPALLNGKPVDHVMEFTQTFPRVLAPRTKGLEKTRASSQTNEATDTSETKTSDVPTG